MIVAKQMIETNKVLSAGWSVSIGKIREKLQMNQQPSLKRYVKCAIPSENQQNQHLLSVSFTLGRVEAKLWELKHLLNQKNSPNEKPP